MGEGKRANHRQRLRDQGMRPLEVWLPEPMIERIDALKVMGESRDAIIAKIIAETLEDFRPSAPASQLQLAL
jgi:hypothetical protein